MLFAIYYTFRSATTGREVSNHCLIMGDNAVDARRAFHDVYWTEAGEHKIVRVEKFSTVELDTLPL
jgi:hypothetical protein